MSSDRRRARPRICWCSARSCSKCQDEGQTNGRKNACIAVGTRCLGRRSEETRQTTGSPLRLRLSGRRLQPGDRDRAQPQRARCDRHGAALSGGLRRTGPVGLAVRPALRRAVRGGPGRPRRPDLAARRGVSGRGRRAGEHPVLPEHGRHDLDRARGRARRRVPLVPAVHADRPGDPRRAARPCRGRGLPGAAGDDRRAGRGVAAARSAQRPVGAAALRSAHAAADRGPAGLGHGDAARRHPAVRIRSGPTCPRT